MTLEDVLSAEKEAVSSQGAKNALEKLASLLEKLEPVAAEGFIAHLKGLAEFPQFYGALPEFPKKPTDPYKLAQASGDLPTHDAVTEYEDDMMYYRNECRDVARELAKACRAFAESR